MTANQIRSLRLRNQRIVRSGFRTAQEVVAWLGAVQAQEFTGAKWGVGLRAKGLTEAAIEREFDQGRILRTHILRPTWHFVAPADIRWMLSISGPRVHAANAHYYRKTGADPALVVRSRKIIERALEGGNALTRNELAARLARCGHCRGRDAARVSHDARRAGCRDLQRAAPRQAVHLHAARRARATGSADVSRRSAGGARRSATSRVTVRQRCRTSCGGRA